MGQSCDLQNACGKTIGGCNERDTLLVRAHLRGTFSKKRNRAAVEIAGFRQIDDQAGFCIFGCLFDARPQLVDVCNIHFSVDRDDADTIDLARDELSLVRNVILPNKGYRS
jgi:hypothetical protein